VIVAVLFGFSNGFNMPTLMAWTVDLSDENYRGRAVATTYIALEAGIGIGALFAGYIYQGNMNNIVVPYILAAVLSFGAFVYLFYQQKNHRQVLSQV
jgi:predicted MFS family arabinose efflux permease